MNSPRVQQAAIELDSGVSKQSSMKYKQTNEGLCFRSSRSQDSARGAHAQGDHDMHLHVKPELAPTNRELSIKHSMSRFPERKKRKREG